MPCIHAQDDLNVITGKWLEYTDARNSLYRYLTQQAYDLLDMREKKINEIRSVSEWQARQKFISSTLLESEGPFPQKTPLNPRITRTIEKKDYRVQHIIYESVPGFYVTSSLYLPAGMKKNSKLPCIIYCSGHSGDGYRSDVYQHVILNLVRKGFIVFAFDPVGQGERLEYYDQNSNKSLVGGPTSEHSYPGAQAFLTGSSQARYMIWDGIRAVDYLLTRKEIDPSRIGITGRSGGGTQSAFIAAYDDRIYAAAPENYITNYKRLLQTIGPQDAEQNIFNFIAKGLDHPDFLIVRAPKPTLMITTSNDMFSMQGVRETEKEVTRIYESYGKPENFSRTEDDAPHASTKKNREAMYAFFQKFLNNPGNPADEDVPPLTKEEMMVTPTGQLSTSLKGETVFTLNQKEANDLESRLNASRKDNSFLSGVITNAKKLSGYHEPAENDKPVFAGRVLRKDYSIEKYFVKGEGDYIIPYLLFKPSAANGKAMLYLDPEGKSAGAKEGGDIEQYVKQGITVLAPDLLDAGEMGPGDLHGDAYFKGASHNMWYASMLVGRSIAGIQAGDAAKLASLLKNDGHYTKISGLARKTMSPVLLLAAAFSKNIDDIILVEPYSSFMAVATERFYNPWFILSTVPAALQNFDLPDIAATHAPGKMMIAGATDGSGKKDNSARITADMNIITEAYKKSNSSAQLIISDDQPDAGSLAAWINR
jgi:cephalosporin-C deacetylase-like acetyl esterase